MSKDNVRLCKYVGMIFIAVLLCYKLPHDSYTSVQYIIKPIKYKNGAIYLWGIIPVILVCIGIKGIWGLERFSGKKKIWSVLVILVFVIPFMKWTIDFARTNYHSLKNDGINSIDIEESNISIGSSNSSTTINITLKLRAYTRRHNEFKIRVYLPKSLREYTGKEYYELENLYAMGGDNNTLNLQEQIVINVGNTDRLDKLLNTQWYHEDVKYELYDDKETVDILEHGY